MYYQLIFIHCIRYPLFGFGGKSWSRALLKEVEGWIINFIWSRDVSIRKLVTISWRNTCCSLSEGIAFGLMVIGNPQFGIRWKLFCLLFGIILGEFWAWATRLVFGITRGALMFLLLKLLVSCLLSSARTTTF